MSRGIFSLKEAYDEQVSGQWSTRGDVFLSPGPFRQSHPFAYFNGGDGSPPNDSVSRFNFDSDTAITVSKGSLNQGRRRHASVANQDFGYVGGGQYSSPAHSDVERIDFGNDTATAVTKGPLVAAASYLGAVGNSEFAYFVAGGPASVTAVNRINYANDTVTQVGNITPARDIAATGNANFGYVAAQGSSGPTNIFRIDYANDGDSPTPKGQLSTGRKKPAATGNAEFGYWGGGEPHPSNPDATAAVDRINYANDTVQATPKGPLSASRKGLAAAGNTSHGYFAGGKYSPSTEYSLIDRIDYSNDTATATAKGPLNTSPNRNFELAGMSPKSNAISGGTLFPTASPERQNVVPLPEFGYIGGGINPAPSIFSSVDRLDFSNDTATASPRGNVLGSPVKELAAMGNTTHGYFAGGRDPSSSPSTLSTVDRIDYSSDTSSAAPKGNLTGARYNHCATGNQHFGYVAGASSNPLSSGLERINYSNDTAQASPLTSAFAYDRNRPQAMGNQNFGYVAGGIFTQSTIDRIDYSNDTVSPVLAGNMIPARNPGTNSNGDAAATSNADFGYIGGGGLFAGYTFVERLDFANDTANTVEKGSLTVGRYKLAATGTPDFGYFAGGASPSETFTIVDRIDYSNDTVTATPKGRLSVERGNSKAAVSPKSHGLPLKGVGILETPVAFGSFNIERVQGTDFGYFGGGAPPFATNARSTVDRIDYSNDTADAVPRGPLDGGRYRHSAQGNANFGYFMGGDTANSTLVERIDYFNDLANTSPRGNLEVGGPFGAATGNDDFAYRGGGFTSGGANSSKMERIEYASDVALSLEKGPLTAKRYSLAATGNLNFGYFAGGILPGSTPSSSIDRIDYSNDSIKAAPRGPLSEARTRHGGVGNADFGYFGGSSSGPSSQKVDRVDYANDTATAIYKGALFSPGRYDDGNVSTLNHGYFAGGNTPGPHTSKIDRIDFANDTNNAATKGGVSISRYLLQGTSSRDNGRPTTTLVNYALGTNATPNFGYFAGGRAAEPLSSIDRINYANDTVTAAPKGELTQEKKVGGGVSSDSYAYFGGGRLDSGGPSPWNLVSIVERIDYFNDTAQALERGPLDGNRYNQAAVNNANFGYFGGGWTPSPATIQRIDFANDLVDAVAKSNLSRGNQNFDATGNQDFGYFGGGDASGPNPIVSSVDRLDYSNDTTNASPKGPLTLARFALRATGNANFGYFGGGKTPSDVSRVDRINYANDTVDATPKGPLTLEKSKLAATGDSSFGYFGGGSPSPGLTTVDRIDYSNDTATASPKGPLSGVRYNHAAAGARAHGFVPIAPSVDSNAEAVALSFNPTNFGYFATGTSAISQVDRIDYSNDTADASPRGNLEHDAEEASGVSSPLFGYVAGGHRDTESRIQRIEYANDTATSAPKGFLNEARNDMAPFGNTNFGYFAGGNYSSNYLTQVSIVSRMDYSNDTVRVVEKGPLNAARYRFGGSGNQNFGYASGGLQPVTAAVDKIDYANDTVQASPKGNLNTARRSVASTGNANFGYVCGGHDGSNVHSIVDRIEYANDTATAAPKGNLSHRADKCGAAGNQDFGYVGGGYNPAIPGITSEISRIDYSNDDIGASQKGHLQSAKQNLTGFSAGDNGLPQ